MNPWSCALVGMNNTSKSCPAFLIFAVGLSTASCWYFAGHRYWHRNIQLALIVSLNSSSSSSMKFFSLNCLALSSFGFSIAHLCFAFFLAAPDIRVHLSGLLSSGREVLCFLVSLHPDHVYPSGGLSFNKMNLVKPVHASDNSFSPSTFQQSSICFLEHHIW